jgi:hypothetical protein
MSPSIVLGRSIALLNVTRSRRCPVALCRTGSSFGADNS